MQLAFDYLNSRYVLPKSDLLSRIRCYLVSSEHYQGRFDDLVKTNVASDVWKVYGIFVDDLIDTDDTVWAPVTYDLADRFGLTIDMLEKAATNDDYVVKSLNDILGLPCDASPLVAVSNHNMRMGASAILNKSAQRDICNRFGDKYYIIPSSVHEMLAAPVDVLPPDDIVRVIKAINSDRGLISSGEILSDHLFMYDRGEISVVA
ncbi:MAG: DUF5688 family protein [Clostridiales bacterium]|nr:DUF5688 family protein [Clostridiales bacterium]